MVQTGETILMSGASGMLGSAVRAALEARGSRVIRLVRREPTSQDELRWFPDRPIESPASSPSTDTFGEASRIGQLENLFAAVHLSGANVSAGRWTAAYKREITESRVGTTRALSEGLAKLKRPPRVLVAASAIGLFGNRGDELLDEDSAAGAGFFPDLCRAWEAATRPAEEAGIRVVHLRFGVVVGPEGGILGKLVPIFRLGLGGPLGNGKQWMSWVSEADAVDAALFALDQPGISGAYNVVSPEPVTNADFTRDLGRAVHRPAVIPAPAFALRLVFGQMADEALLASTRAIPKRLPAAGFQFQHPSLPEALAWALPELPG